MSIKTLTVELPNPHPGQRRLIQESRRYNVVCCGRRFGKTKFGIDRVSRAAIDGHPAAWFSPTYPMMTEVWRDLLKTLRPVIARSNAQERRVDLITGGTVEMWSLDRPDTARGRKYKTIVVDEAAMVRTLDDAWQQVIRPTLTDYRGDAWFLSTPKGRNYFWQLYQRGQSDDRDWMSWQMPTVTNPFIDPTEVDAARTDPSMTDRAFQQEYLAQFLEDGPGVFRRISEAATVEPLDAAEDGHTYAFGVDWGKHEDFTVFVVVDLETRSVVHMDRFNQIDYRFQLGRLVALYDRFMPITVVAERNSMGEPLIEQLMNEGLPVQPFTTNQASKMAAIESLSLAFERGLIQIPNDPILTGELLAYESERLPSGMLRYGAPSGMHDDCVMALAFAWQAAQYQPFRGI